MISPTKTATIGLLLLKMFSFSVAGKFLLGTPPTCVKPPAPQDGRWVCSYSEGVNGRSLCILDCKRDYVIEGRPLIFNCVNGAWKMFPIPITHIERPWGTCIPIEIYRAQMSMEDAKRAIGTERRKATNSDNNNGYTSKRSGALSNALKEIDLAKYF